MKKFFKTLHLWLSLPAGVFIVLLCLTGALLVFQQDIQEFSSPGFYRVYDAGGKERLPLDSLAQVAAADASVSGKSIESVTCYADTLRTVEFGVSGMKGTYCTVDPYTAEISGKGQPLSSFFSTVRNLHRWLLLEGDARVVGRTIIGISALFFLLILVSGFIISFQRSLKQWKTALTVKRGRNSFVWWFTSHRAFGLYCVIFLFLMSSTGPMWSFSWYRSAVAAIFGTEMQASAQKTESKPEGAQKGQNKSERAVDYGKWACAVNSISKIEPDYVSITVTGDKASVKTLSHNQRASDTYKLDGEGRVIGIDRYDEQPLQSKIMGYAYIIHTGLWGGWLVKLLYFLACIGGIYLVVSGYVLYVRRISGTKRS